MITNDLVTVKRNFLTEEERIELSEIIYKELSKRPFEQHDVEYIVKNRLAGEIVWVDNYGRGMLDATRMVPKPIISKVLSTLEEVGYPIDNNKVEVIFLRYSKDMGFPELEPHIDCQQNGVSIDYQLGSNISWDIVVEGKEYSLEDNDAIAFNVSKLVHWREPRLFEDGEYIDMLLFHVTFYGELAGTWTMTEKAAIAQPAKDEYVKKITALQKTVGVDYKVKDVPDLP